jgi:hypothetical protein
VAAEAAGEQAKQQKLTLGEPGILVLLNVVHYNNNKS